MNLDAIQSALRDQHLDGWLFYDHHHRDPIAYRILGLDPQCLRLPPLVLLHPRRRRAPQARPPHRVRQARHPPRHHTASTPPGRNSSKISKPCSTAHTTHRHAVLPAQRHHVRLHGRRRNRRAHPLHGQGRRQLRRPRQPLRSRPHRGPDRHPLRRPGDASTASSPPAGSTSATTSSATITPTSSRSSASSSRPCSARASGPTTAPTCSAGPNSADSHYEPTRRTLPPPSATATSSSSTSGPSSPIAPTPSGTTSPGPASSAANPPTASRHIFTTVRDARDAAIAAVQARLRRRPPIAGWQADDAARNVIRDAGFGDFFTHRTGHNIGHRTPRQRRPPRQPRDPRRAPAPAQHLLLRRARHLLPRRVRHPQRGQHDHPARQGSYAQAAPTSPAPSSASSYASDATTARNSRTDTIEQRWPAPTHSRLPSVFPARSPAFPRWSSSPAGSFPASASAPRQVGPRAAALRFRSSPCSLIGLALAGQDLLAQHRRHPRHARLRRPTRARPALRAGPRLRLGSRSSVNTLADYGTKFLVVGGLLNIIAAVDAHSLANGRKAS